MTTFLEQLKDEQLLKLDAIHDLKLYLSMKTGQNIENFKVLPEGIQRRRYEGLYRIMLCDEKGKLYPVDCLYNKTYKRFMNIRCDLRNL